MRHPLTITRNRTALLAVVATIVALLGGRDGGFISRRLRNAALALLRPAEAAARRLIVIAARGLVVAPRPAPVFAVAPGQGAKAGEKAGAAGVARPRAFPLFDRRKRFVLALRRAEPRGVPRIRTFFAPPLILSLSKDATPAASPPPPAPAPRPDPDAPVDSTRLRLRLGALSQALADLPHQARRLARLRARATPRSPLRIGRPPGWRAKPKREVDHVLRECHALAMEALRADTS